MSTWQGPPPPVLPQAGPLRKIVAGARGAVVFAWLALMIAIYLPLKWAEPLTGRWRPRYAVMRTWARVSLRLMGLRRVVHGAPARGVALVANHSSWLDIMLFCSIGRVAFVAKSEVAGWAGVGWCARMMDAMFVERRAAAAAAQTVEMSERLARGQQLLFFPEGTSTDGQRVLPFKSSLFAVFDAMGADAPVQPVAARYVAPEGMPPDFYGWWGDMSLGGHAWQMLQWSWGGVVHLDFGPVLDPATAGGRKMLARTSEQHVREGWAAHGPVVAVEGTP
ncbi:lysophospholipid acyltransferase family protein [Roseobacter sp. HKCCA0434]|uniref:lysophospholipid acyltransferase family protein n=1 Tax=Roseobacter sp. HKCCA0434 TaxID=3079297 RepID=UPI002905D2AC|nr:lysophospholipid acyltransferase family protein [Roseobacter sp. HKCCA0434]